MDELKKYLQQYKQQLDIDEPSATVLHRLQTQTVKPKSKVVTMLLRVSAVACIIAGVVFGVKFFTDNTATPPTIATVNAVDTNPPIISKQQSDIIDTTQQNPIVKNTTTVAVISKKEINNKQANVPYQLMNSFERNYTQLVNLQLKNIRTMPVYGETQDYFNEFKNSLRQIDIDESNIKKNIKTNGLNDALLEQLIAVYQEKINVLKSLQHEIIKMNNKVKENQQPSDTLKSHYINI